MRLLTRSNVLAAVNTGGPQWVVPTRVAVGVMLLFPADGAVQQLLAFSHPGFSVWPPGAVAVGLAIRGFEVLAGVSFVAGFGIRLSVYPAAAIFAVRALVNFANTFAWLRDAVSAVFVPHGDWAYGALYLGVALLLGDLQVTGSGRWSIDYWLCKRLNPQAKPDARR
ncbi:hypothetical protein PPMP20_30440 [Paraburkholderia phymatum]|uniref:DoxX family protein n=1 Tax=Paraburkholderia phymatum (strain DSM 17167 / CIP 108236 / LMG 21445 / STM815) TaxID=391038 RepID=B2JM92_PARP8|nr:hypothetical protein [Paraburkholderia phymatum]ACC74227.1 conserved hypothetical protein [Paraburkholderia phymatum STM815]